MPVSSRRLQAPAGPHGLVLNHTVEHGSSGQCAIISGFHLSPILGKPSLAKAAATPNPHRPTPAVPRVPSSGAFGRRPPYTGRPLAPGRHPKPFTNFPIPGGEREGLESDANASCDNVGVIALSADTV